MLLGGLVAADTYPARAAMLPRLVALITMALLVAVFVSRLRHGRAHAADRLPVRVAHLTSPAIWWIPLFLISLWSFGFIVGAPLAILGYLVFETQEHPVRSVAIGVCSYLVLEIALHRLLGVALWEGALQTWVG